MFSLQRILGNEDKFFDLLQESADACISSVQALGSFLLQPQKVRSLEEFILSRRREKKVADEISQALCTTFITALEREDIEALSIALYKIPKTVEKVAERILIAPQFVQGLEFTRQLESLKKATEIIAEMLRDLRKEVNIERIKEKNQRLRIIEGEADKHMLELLRELYTSENPAAKVIFLKDLYELLEKVADRCRDAGNIINHIVLKNS